MKLINIYVTLFLAAIAAMACAPQVAARPAMKIRAEADTATLTMGDRTAVRVEVTTPSLDGRLVDLPGPETDYHGMEICGIEADTAATGNGLQRITYTVTLQAFEPQAVTLPPFRYALGTDTVQSAPLAFKVLPVELSPELGDPEDVENLTIHAEEPPQAIPLRWYDYIPAWSLWVLIGVAVVALAIVVYKLYKKNGPALVVRRKEPTPFEIAMRRLTQLRNSGLVDRAQFKQFFTELTDILRQYLEGRFGINALEMTSTEILRRLRENPQTHLTTEQVRQVLELADFVKFAAATPAPEEAKKMFNTVLRFVEDTKPQPQPDDEKSGTKRRPGKPSKSSKAK